MPTAMIYALWLLCKAGLQKRDKNPKGKMPRDGKGTVVFHPVW
jgi:hypothetical protein